MKHYTDFDCWYKGNLLENLVPNCFGDKQLHQGIINEVASLLDQAHAILHNNAIAIMEDSTVSVFVTVPKDYDNFDSQTQQSINNLLKSQLIFSDDKVCYIASNKGIYPMEHMQEVFDIYQTQYDDMCKFNEAKAKGEIVTVVGVTKAPYGKGGKAKYVATFSDGTSEVIRKGNNTYNFCTIGDSHKGLTEWAGGHFSNNPLRASRQIQITEA